MEFPSAIKWNASLMHGTRINLQRSMMSENANSKRLHTVWFRLYHTLEMIKSKHWEQVSVSQQGVAREEWGRGREGSVRVTPVAVSLWCIVLTPTFWSWYGSIILQMLPLGEPVYVVRGVSLCSFLQLHVNLQFSQNKKFKSLPAPKYQKLWILILDSGDF